MTSRRLASIVAAALFAAGCGGSKAGPPPLTAAEQLVAGELQVRSMARVGVRPELGAGADAFFSDLDAARAAGLAAMPAPLRPPVGLPGAALRPAATVAGASGTSALGTLLLMIEPGVNQAGVNNRTGSTHTDLPNGAADTSFVTTLTQSGSTLSASISQTVVYTARDGRTVTELTTGSAQLQVCPDAAGLVPIAYNFHFDIRTPGGGAQIDVGGTGQGVVGDDAGLQSWTTDSTISHAAQGSALPVAGSDATVHLTQSFDWASAVQTGHTTTVVRNSTVDSIVAGLVDVANTVPARLARQILEKAQAHWQGGECVEIVVAGTGDSNLVAINSTTSFTGTVHHRIEGVDLPLPITAALSGSQSVAPTAPTTSPVSYAYVAGPRDGVLSTVALETRSRRGVGKKAVAFSTQVLHAYAGTIAFSCTVADPAPSTASWSGSSTVRLVASSSGGGGGVFQPDPASGSTTFSTWATDSSSQACALVGTGTGSAAQILGSFVLLAAPPQYEFGMVAQGTGTLRCVAKPSGNVTTVSTPLATNLNNSPAPGVLSWVPVTDPALLSGTVHFHSADPSGATMDCDTTWSLTPQ